MRECHTLPERIESSLLRLKEPGLLRLQSIHLHLLLEWHIRRRVWRLSLWKGRGRIWERHSSHLRLKVRLSKWRRKSSCLGHDKWLSGHTSHLRYKGRLAEGVVARHHWLLLALLEPGGRWTVRMRVEHGWLRFLDRCQEINRRLDRWGPWFCGRRTGL